jgi:hypothetical protein
MSSRPSAFKKGGGGFLNNVDGVISGYEFTDEFGGEPFKAGKVNGKERFHSLYFVLSARVDGADEDVTTTLFVGGADDFNVEEDGHTLTPVEEGRELGANTPFAKLITSLVEAGFPETNLPEDAINFESIIGTRVRFVQRTDVEGTKKLGKRKDKKTGKEYDRQDLVIDQVYSLPGTETAKAAPAKAGKPVAAKAGKAAKVAPVPAGVDVAELATDTLTTILSEAGGTITKAKMGMKVIAKLMKDPNREAVRKFLFDDENLGAIDGVDYDKATSTISIAA